MKTLTQDFQYLKFVEFKDLVFWDVKRYINNSNYDSKHQIVRLGKHLFEQTKKLKLSNFPDQDFKILGVNNKDGLFDAYIEKGKNINQPYKIVKNGYLAYNPYRVNVGSVGLKSDLQKHEYISNAYVVFSADESNLSSEFLFKLFKTEFFNKLIRQNTKGAVRQNLSFDLLANIQIPLPPLETQKRLVENYQTKITQAENNKVKITELEKQIETYLMDELGIEIVEKQKQDNGYKYLQFIEFRGLERWGVEYLSKIKNQYLNNKYPIQKVTNFIEVNPKTFLPMENLDISFIPMECVSDVFGEIIETRIGEKAKSSGYTKFQENDLIWAKITPCMQNGKSAIVKNLLNNFGYGSTEFHVFRAKEKTNLRFFYHLFRSEYIRKEAMSYFTGTAGQQRVPASYFEDMKLPLPPLEVQEKIVAQIDKWKVEIKELKQQTESLEIQAKEDFEKAVFN